ncbi:UNVERIFIED_CONTAM: hypothetical protein Sradi_4807300 [Sesamum radiatum]|uniref:Uncharacterized protein n=1 Tax=Sesamum radiatum TaxID=300843 RepID=A0AAW2MWR2_SESRA
MDNGARQAARVDMQVVSVGNQYGHIVGITGLCFDNVQDGNWEVRQMHKHARAWTSLKHVCGDDWQVRQAHRKHTCAAFLGRLTDGVRREHPMCRFPYKVGKRSNGSNACSHDRHGLTTVSSD